METKVKSKDRGLIRRSANGSHGLPPLPFELCKGNKFRQLVLFFFHFFFVARLCSNTHASAFEMRIRLPSPLRR